jgi:APA family basic amino acid/polyamine antiporter
MDNVKPVETASSNINIDVEPTPPPGNLKKPELYALSIGQVIGAGCITLTGPAIAMTGMSAWLAYAIAIALGFLIIFPVVLMTSTLRLGGGPFSMIEALAGPRFGGMYIYGTLVSSLGISLMGVALGVYISSVVPGVSTQFVAAAAMTIFFVVNLLGISMMANAQKLMTWVLIAALMMFVVVGFPQLKNPIFNFSHPEFMPHGFGGLLSAAYLLLYSTQGYSMTSAYGRQAHNAKRDIPWAILISIPTLIVIYCGIDMVAAGVLPLAQVAGKPLTYAAKAILPTPLFYAFILGGPVMAVATTLNSSMPYSAIQFAQASQNGWMPKSLAKQNKRGASWVFLTYIYVVGMIPIVLNFSVTVITNNIQLVGSFLSFLSIVAYYKLPTKYPEAWKKSKFHMPDWLYYTFISLCCALQISVFVKSIINLKLAIVLTNLVALAVCLILANLVYTKGKIQIKRSVWAD